MALAHQRSGSVAKMFFEGIRKMRQVFKPHFVINFHRIFFLLCKLIMCQLQSFLSEPLLWGCVEYLFEIALECSDATSGEITKFFHGYIEHIVLLHVAD